jgi:hypothetical protein
MNKSGKILLLEPDTETCGFLPGMLQATAGKNEVVCYSDINDANHYLNENVSDVFLVLQNLSSQALHLPESRNMVYMHEKFNIESIAYMFLVQSKEETLKDGLHTFIHCYYKPQNPAGLAKVLEMVIDFWKDHIFPVRVARNYTEM